MAITIPVCKEHGQEATKQCSWCSRPICDGCVKAAQGRKLCVNCVSKLAKEMPLGQRDPTRRGIQNKDHSLTQDQIDEARHLLVDKKRPKVGRIVNEPSPTVVKNTPGPRVKAETKVEDDWPELLE